MQTLTISQLQTINETNGGFYFSSGATHSFKAQYHSLAFLPGDNAAYFVDSVKPPHEKRVYRLCKMVLTERRVDILAQFKTEMPAHRRLNKTIIPISASLKAKE